MKKLIKLLTVFFGTFILVFSCSMDIDNNVNVKGNATVNVDSDKEENNTTEESLKDEEKTEEPSKETTSEENSIDSNEKSSEETEISNEDNAEEISNENPIEEIINEVISENIETPNIDEIPVEENISTNEENSSNETPIENNSAENNEIEIPTEESSSESEVSSYITCDEIIPNYWIEFEYDIDPYNKKEGSFKIKRELISLNWNFIQLDNEWYMFDDNNYICKLDGTRVIAFYISNDKCNFLSGKNFAKLAYSITPNGCTTSNYMNYKVYYDTKNNMIIIRTPNYIPQNYTYADSLTDYPYVRDYKYDDFTKISTNHFVKYVLKEDGTNKFTINSQSITFNLNGFTSACEIKNIRVVPKDVPYYIRNEKTTVYALINGRIKTKVGSHFDDTIEFNGLVCGDKTFDCMIYLKHHYFNKNAYFEVFLSDGDYRLVYNPIYRELVIKCL